MHLVGFTIAIIETYFCYYYVHSISKIIEDVFNVSYF